MRRLGDLILRFKNWLFFVAAGMSLLEVLCIHYGLGFAVLDRISATIVDNLLLAYVSSYIFYLLIVQFPDSIQKKSRTKYLYSNLQVVVSNVDFIRYRIFREKDTIECNDYRLVDDFFSAPNNLVSFERSISVIIRHIEKLELHHEYFSYETLLDIDELRTVISCLTTDSSHFILEASKLTLGKFNINYLLKIFELCKNVSDRESDSLNIAKQEKEARLAMVKDEFGNVQPSENET